MSLNQSANVITDGNVESTAKRAFNARYDTLLQLAEWELDQANSSGFESLSRLLEEPQVDLLSAILLASQLNASHMTAFVLGKKIRIEGRIERIRELKKQYQHFIHESQASINAELEAFSELREADFPQNNSGFSKWISTIINFYRGNDPNKVGAKNLGAFGRLAKVEAEFNELVGNYYGDSVGSQMESPIFATFNQLDAWQDKVMPNHGNYDDYKSIENFISKLVFGSTFAEAIIPGTVKINQGILSIQQAFSTYLGELHEAIMGKMQAALSYESERLNLDMDVLQELTEDYSTEHLQTLKRIIEVYYRALLDIIERVPV